MVTPFLSFKGITQAYLPKISITHDKNLIPLLNLLINCMSAKSGPQILALNDEYTFLFLNFLIIGLCNSSANYSFCSIAIAPPEVFLSKNS